MSKIGCPCCVGKAELKKHLPPKKENDMHVDFKKMYSSKLVEDLEKERQTILKEATPSVPKELAMEFIQYSRQEYVRKYCQMSINKLWHDYFTEIVKNHRLDEQGRYDEMTLPEMMTDKSSWTDEDHKVFAAIMAARAERIER